MRRSGRRRRVGEEDAGLAVDHCFERAAPRQRDDRPAARLRLERYDPEVFFTRQDHGQRATIFVAQRLVRQRSQEFGLGSALALQPLAIGTIADDAQPGAGDAAGLDRQIDPLVRHQG